MADSPPKRVDRVGVVATDPLRVLGLQTIFSEAMQIEIVSLSVPGALDDANLSLVLIDAGCTPHLFELIATFRQTHPLLKLIVLGNDTSQDYIQRVIGGRRSHVGIPGQRAYHGVIVKLSWRVNP